MGSLLSSYYAFDPQMKLPEGGWFHGASVKREDNMRLGGMGRLTYVFGGDSIRQGLCRDLSFSPYHEGGRAENLRRISAFIYPLRADREKARKIINCGRFFGMTCYKSENGCYSTERAYCGYA